MTLGEKILHYRKKSGLSQEELAKELFVSRQTISLWETGQTLPTIDNLVRLREIFGVTVDELLNGDAEEAPEEPSEVCRFSCDKREAGSILRGLSARAVFSASLLICLAVLFPLLCICAKAPDSVIGIFVGLVLPLIVLAAARLAKLASANRRNAAKLSEKAYEYLLFSDKVEIRVSGEDGARSVSRFGYDEIKTAAESDGLLLLDFGTGFYAMRKAELAGDSPILGLKPKKRVRFREHGRLYTASLVLFAITIASIPGAFVFASGIENFTDWSTHWLSFMPFIILSVASYASAVIGIILTAKRERGAVKNIVTGFAVGTPLALIGWICFWVAVTGGV